MTQRFSGLHSLRRVFYEGFSAQDIAEPLVSFDATAPAGHVRRFMEDRGFEVVGVREEGVVIGWADRTELADGSLTDCARAFGDADVIPDRAPLRDVIGRLEETPRVFVSLLGHVGGIVTRTDLQKPPVRMWLFGMITLIEMRFSTMIAKLCPGESWQQYLSEGRLAKAKDLLAERTRRNQQIDMLDCLQFGDKGQIIARCEAIRALTRFESRRQIEQAFKGLERLRNNLAHAQDIITGDWEIIVRLSENLDRVVEGPAALRTGDDAPLPT